MRRMSYVLALLGALLLSIPGIAMAQSAAQDPVVQLDRRNILPCPASSLMQHEAEINAGTMWLWTADHAGVNPVNPAVRGSNPRRLSEYFRGPVPGKKYSQKEREILSSARAANEASISFLGYTPKGTPVTEVAAQLPNGDYQKLVLPTTDKFEEQVWPCGKLLETGITSGRRTANGSMVISTTRWGAIVAWHERGVTTKDGQPGIRVFVATKSFRPSAGPNTDMAFRVAVIRNCGNPTIVPEPVVETVQVSAPPTIVPQRPEGIILPPQVLNPPAPTPTRPEGQKKQGRPFCLGKVSAPICIGAAAVATALLWPHGPESVALPSKCGGGKACSPGLR